MVTQGFVLSVSDKLPLEKVAPLLCAGITTYSPLRHWGVKKGHKLAVVGLGGLGHMAVKLAASMGAEVTMLSRSPEKAIDAAHPSSKGTYPRTATHETPGIHFLARV